jgi:4-amino-4-deoxy-L-arabinose transferase-like glycosyltransferase
VIRRLDHVWQNPTALVGLLIVGQIVAWTLAPALVHSAPPLDVVEGYMWGREWVIATYKHPALPSWVLEASRVATAGTLGWPAYLASQLFVAATFVFVFLLGRDMAGPARAAAGTLLLTGVAYFAWPTPEFNHNVAEMPFWAGLPWALWRAVERRSIGWWAFAGALAAGGLYAKLTTALLLVALAGWIVWDVRARRCLATLGPWIGLVVFAVLIFPLARWLVVHDFAPLRYAAQRAGGFAGDGTGRPTGGGVASFLLNQVVNLAGMLVMLAIAGLIGPLRRARPVDAAPEPQPEQVSARAVAYLIVLTAGPLVLAIASALLTGSSLRAAWGSSMFNYAGVLVIALTSKRFDGQALRRLAICAAVAISVVPLGYAVVVAAGPMRAGNPMRVNWPQAEIASRFATIWARETGRPLRIVTGDSWIAGLVGVTASGLPSIFTRGDAALSPWITPGRVEREGMLIVWDARTKRIPESLQHLVDALPARAERFGWKRSKDGADLTIGYAIVPPKQGPR